MALPPEQYARELRFRLALHGPIDVVKVASSLGIEVHEGELDQCDGALLRLGGTALILVSRKCAYDSRKRFTVAHELGHFYIPSHNSPEFRCTEAEIANYRSVRIREREANGFASELLLPASELQKALKEPPSIQVVSDLAQSYGTSMMATAVKVVQATCESVAVVLSSRGRIEWAVRSRSFPFSIRSGTLHEHTYAIDYFTSGYLPGCTKQVLLSAWCKDSGCDEFLMEESIPFHRLNMVLSLLSLPAQDEDY
jgi:hypothetical protein